VFDWNQYKGNLTWLPNRTIYMTIHGSHAYGTNIVTSDIDLRGVFIAPKEYYFGCIKTIEQIVQLDPDLSVFELRKFLKLASVCNPNILELLYTETSDHLITTPLGKKLLDNRALFLNKRVKSTFFGYAFSQLKKINTHYKFLKNPPTNPPLRADFDIPIATPKNDEQMKAAFAMIQKRIDEWSWHEMRELDAPLRQSIQDEFNSRLQEITKWNWKDINEKVWNCAANSIGFETNFLELLNKERLFMNKMKEWQNYNEWKKNRNPARAALEEKYGYDLKHGMHLVRLLLTCKEILTDGIFRVKRPDATMLLDIRNGSWSYEKLILFAEEMNIELDDLVKKSTLPQSANQEKIDQLCIEMVEESFIGENKCL
jgi:predicted nucleotidyltransferase